MKTNSLFWAMTWVAVGSFAMMQGCGGDDDDDGGSGDDKGGSSGSSSGGSSGSNTGGSSGSNTGGTSGTNTGGTSGTGTGGSAGAPGGAGGEGGGSGGGSGDEERATVCGQYCTLYWSKVCYEAPSDTYTDQDDCQSTCEDASWGLGDSGDAAGNTVHCRLTHAGLATDMAPPDNTHCGHASEVPTGVCVD